MGKEINDLIVKAHNCSLKHGFWENGRNFGDIIAYIHNELSEVYTEYINHRSYNEVYYDENGKPCGIPTELSDVIIMIFDLCGGLKIDLEKCILEKIEYNETRPYKHDR